MARRTKKEIPAPAPVPEPVKSEPVVEAVAELTEAIGDKKMDVVKIEEITQTFEPVTDPATIEKIGEEVQKTVIRKLTEKPAGIEEPGKTLVAYNELKNVTPPGVVDDVYVKVGEWRDPLFEALMKIDKHPEIPREAYVVIDNIKHIKEMLEGKMASDRKDALAFLKDKVPDMFYKYMHTATVEEKAEKAKIIIEKYGKKD